MAYFAELSASGLGPVRFEGSGDLDCLCIAKGGIEGWWSTPAAKVNVTARGQGDGGHDVSEDDISYASRTVTLHWNANASSRDALLALTDSVRRLVHRQVTMRVVDGNEDTYCSGGDMVRYGGKATGLQYPVQYGVEVSDSRNACVLHNDGTSRAYPIFQATGPFPDGVAVAFQDGSSLSYSQPVGVTPLILDSRSHSATIGGVDVSRGLIARGFPVIEPGGSLGVTLQSSGSGWVTCVTHDAYM